jgi:hypothetical protein
VQSSCCRRPLNEASERPASPPLGDNARESCLGHDGGTITCPSELEPMACMHRSRRTRTYRRGLAGAMESMGDFVFDGTRQFKLNPESVRRQFPGHFKDFMRWLSSVTDPMSLWMQPRLGPGPCHSKWVSLALDIPLSRFCAFSL